MTDPVRFLKTPGLDAGRPGMAILFRCILVFVALVMLAPIVLALATPASARSIRTHREHKIDAKVQLTRLYDVPVYQPEHVAAVREFRSKTKHADWPRIIRQPRSATYIKSYFTP